MYISIRKVPETPTSVEVQLGVTQVIEVPAAFLAMRDFVASKAAKALLSTKPAAEPQAKSDLMQASIQISQVF